MEKGAHDKWITPVGLHLLCSLKAYPETRLETRRRAVFCIRGRVQKQFSDSLLTQSGIAPQGPLQERNLSKDEEFL